MRTTHCRLDFVERSSFNFWSPVKQTFEGRKGGSVLVRIR